MWRLEGHGQCPGGRVARTHHGVRPILANGSPARHFGVDLHKHVGDQLKWNTERCILFVTGKGILKKNNETNKDTRLYYGKIRESFFSWTEDETMQKYILSVEMATMEHGSDGAFYVYLRKFKN